MIITIDLKCACGAEGDVTFELDGNTPIGDWIMLICSCHVCGQEVKVQEKAGVLVGRELKRREKGRVRT